MKSIKNITVVPLLLLCFFVGVETASALTISPVKIEVTGDPGQTLNGELELLNEQAGSKTFFSSFENFEPSGDTGSPKFIGSSDGLATWLGTSPNVNVSTGETVKVPYSITIPADAEAGGYFAAIFWGEQDPAAASAGEVAIGGKLGVLILLRVAGDIEEKGGISEFGIVGGLKLKSSLPVGLSYRFSNNGGDRVVPLGDIVIKNMFGATTDTLSANINEGSVLPNSGRKFQTVWGDMAVASTTVGFFNTAKNQLNSFHFGLYKANLSVTFGATNQLATDSVWFFMMPWQLLSLVLVLVCSLILILKKYNSWIISKSKSNS
jgi:hypothetical protein